MGTEDTVPLLSRGLLSHQEEPFLSPWTGCDKNGEGCGEGIKEKERERMALLSRVGLSNSFGFCYSMNIVAVLDEGFPSLCLVVVCIVLEGGACFLCRNLRLRIFQRVEFVLSMRVEGVVKLF